MLSLTKLEWAAFYVGAHIVLILVLALGVVSARRKHGVALGDGANEAMQRAIRVHGNATEYVPMLLIGLTVLSLLDASRPWMIHVLGLLLLVSRIAHAQGLGGSNGRSAGRMFGTLGTWIAALGLALALVWAAFSGGP
jgi:hypothetical protein